MATIAFEVGAGIVQKDREAKFKRHFVNKIIIPMEKSCLKVCDPQTNYIESRFKKLDYKIPDSLAKYSAESTSSKEAKDHWENIFE